MKTKIVSGIVTGSFEDVVNEAIVGLEREGKEVLDVKFSSTFGTPDKHYALILYREDYQPIPFELASAIAEYYLSADKRRKAGESEMKKEKIKKREDDSELYNDFHKTGGGGERQ